MYRYTAKSTRHAASSKAYFVGVSVDLVMSRAGWTNVSSFVMHYNLPITPVLSGSHQNDAVGTLVGSPSKNQKKFFKTYHNVAALRLLQKAKMTMYKKSAQFVCRPFVDLPPPVKKIVLPKPVHVEIPVATSSKGVVKFQKKPYITFTSSVPEDLSDTE